MIRLRIISDAFGQLKQDDPDSAITLCALRRMVKCGEIPTVRIGRKSLINYDLLLQYLQSGYQHSEPCQSEEYGQIRKIS